MNWILTNWNKIRRSQSGMLGLGIMIAFLFLAFFADFIAPYNPTKQSSYFVSQSFSYPSWMTLFDASIPKEKAFGLLGTEDLGRDIFSQLVYGTRVPLIVGFLAASVSVGTGLLIGLLSGYFGGRTDNVFMRVADFMLALPFLPFMIVIASVLGRNIWIIILLIGIVFWTTTARTIRSQVLTLKERTFIESARAIGCTDRRIIFRHILPNVTSLVFANSFIMIALSIIAEAGLSFLGLGDQTTPSWGLMLYSAVQSRALVVGAWWYFVPPGVAILLAVFASMLIGLALEDVFNPQLKARIFR